MVVAASYPEASSCNEAGSGYEAGSQANCGRIPWDGGLLLGDGLFQCNCALGHVFKFAARNPGRVAQSVETRDILRSGSRILCSKTKIELFLFG